MTATNELKASLIDVHRRIYELLSSYDAAVLRGKTIDRWTLLDVIGHVNAWGLEFLREARHMAEKPGQPFDHYLHKVAAVRSQINLACLKAFEAHGIRLGLPVRIQELADGQGIYRA